MNDNTTMSRRDKQEAQSSAFRSIDRYTGALSQCPHCNSWNSGCDTFCRNRGTLSEERIKEVLDAFKKDLKD